MPDRIDKGREYYFYIRQQYHVNMEGGWYSNVLTIQTVGILYRNCNFRLHIHLFIVR